MEALILIPLLLLAFAAHRTDRLRVGAGWPARDDQLGRTGVATRARGLGQAGLSRTIDRYVGFLRRQERALSSGRGGAGQARCLEADIQRARLRLGLYLAEARRRSRA